VVLKLSRRLRALWRDEGGQSIIQVLVTAAVIGILSMGAYYLISSLLDTNANSQRAVSENNALDHIRGFLAARIGQAAPCDLGAWNECPGKADAASSPLAQVGLSGDQLFIQNGTTCSRVYYAKSTQTLYFAEGQSSTDCSLSSPSSLFPRRGPNQTDTSTQDPTLDGSTGAPTPSVLETGIVNGQGRQSSQPIFTYLDANGQPLSNWFVNAASNQLENVIDFSSNTCTSTPSGAQPDACYSSGLTAASDPQAITYGADGKLWFTEYATDQVASLDSSTGAINEYPLPANAQPTGIASSADGKIWVAESGIDSLAEFDPSSPGAIRQYPLAAGTQPYGITAGPNDSIWFTERSSSRIAEIALAPDGTGTVTESAAIPSATLGGIIAGPDSKLWFAMTSSSAVGAVSANVGGLPTASITTVSLPHDPAGITSGPDGNIWVGEGSNLASIDPATHNVTEHSFSQTICALAPSPEGTITLATCDGKSAAAYDPGTSSFTSLYALSAASGSPLAGLNGIAPGGPDAMANGASANGWYSSSDSDVIAAVKVTIAIKIGNAAQVRHFVIPLYTNNAGTTSYGEFSAIYPPYSTSVPQISQNGSSTVSQSSGLAVTVDSDGAWNPDNTNAQYASQYKYVYQWQFLCLPTDPPTKCVPGAWTDIPSADTRSYTPSSGDVGHTVRVQVTASDEGGAGQPAYSNLVQVGP